MNIPESLRSTSVGDLIEEVDRVYGDLSLSIKDFMAKSGLSCPPDCGGRCCHGFEPDILDAEGLYLAAYLRSQAPELAARLGAAQSGGTCPFWDGESGRCTCYPGRALICRAFGFSAMRDAEGESEFRLCFAMPSRKGRGGEEERSWKGSAIDEALGAAPPVMSDYGSRLVALDPEGAGSRGPLGESVLRGIWKIALIERMRGDPDRPDDNPNQPDGTPNHPGKAA